LRTIIYRAILNLLSSLTTEVVQLLVPQHDSLDNFVQDIIKNIRHRIIESNLYDGKKRLESRYQFIFIKGTNKVLTIRADPPYDQIEQKPIGYLSKKRRRALSGWIISLMKEVQAIKELPDEKRKERECQLITILEHWVKAGVI